MVRRVDIQSDRSVSLATKTAEGIECEQAQRSYSVKAFMDREFVLPHPSPHAELAVFRGRFSLEIIANPLAEEALLSDGVMNSTRRLLCGPRKSKMLPC